MTMEILQWEKAGFLANLKVDLFTANAFEVLPGSDNKNSPVGNGMVLCMYTCNLCKTE